MNHVHPRIPASGPLRVLESNRRYFSDGSGKAIYLTGCHTWDNIQDISKEKDSHVFDFTKYLDFLEKYNHNYTRLWAWEQAKWHPHMTEGIRFEPTIYERTGPGRALDGRSKFDVTRFNEAYFERIRSRAMEAGKRGIYVSIMLFGGWCICTKGAPDKDNPWNGHPFNRNNNVNGIDGDPHCTGEGRATQSLERYDITKLQKAYIAWLIDTVNDLDNILYEVSNESEPEATQWHYEMIRFIKDYQAVKFKQHPVGMTGQPAWMVGAPNYPLFESPADWVSPVYSGTEPLYREDPPMADGKKIVLNDTDHLWGIGGNQAWVWKSFCRGLNPVFMDPYDSYYIRLMGKNWADEKPFNARWEPIRKSLGYTRRYAERMDLAHAVPSMNTCLSGYCLVRSGHEYLCYLPNGGVTAIDLTTAPANMAAEWFNPTKGKIIGTERVRGGAVRLLKAPFKGDAVVYLFRR